MTSLLKTDLEFVVDSHAVEDELVDGEWTKLYHPPSTMPPWIPRRSSVSSSSRFKGKDRSSDSDPPTYNADVLDFRPFDSSPALDLSLSSSSSSKHRSSILSAASDVLGFRKKIGSVSRKRQNPLGLHPSHVVPGVIEINACNNSTTVTSTIGGTTAHVDCEHEERERLRDVAAQSIGLGPELLHDACARSFFDPPSSPAQPACIPPFPATLTALYPFTELSATLPKFTPSSSLLVFALSKQWKPRTIVLTLHSPDHKAHVHLFKGASRDDKELERLEVTEDSVIFVAEEEVGGRGHVVKFAGKDVAPKRGGPTGQEGSRTMWLLQIKDPVESHRWITVIKNAVLTQRAMRAGLDVHAQLDGGNEPKGDMDVMLSMHLQRNILTHPIKAPTTLPPPSPSMPASPSPTPSLRSLRIAVPSSPSPTTAVKGIFAGTRSRSPSVEGSPVHTHPPGHAEESFSAAGTSLLTMLRPKPSTESGSPPTHTLSLPLGRDSPSPSLRSTHAPVIIPASDLKISRERDAPELSIVVPEASSSTSTPGSNTPPASSFSPPDPSTFSLQPPPRKYKHAVAAAPATCLHEPQGMYKQANGNCSVAGNFGISSKDWGCMSPTPPTSPDSCCFSGGHSGSLSPNSGFSSPYANDDGTRTQLGNSIINSLTFGGGFVPTDKLPQSTSLTKRWSRQGIPLPKQLTPPSGPPPCIPPENNPRVSVESSMSNPAKCTIDRSPSGSSSSHSHALARINGNGLSSPTFWRRTSTSGCSTYSASTTSTTSDAHIRYQLRVPFCLESVVGGNGTTTTSPSSSRPMSMSVHGSSPVVHAGKAKRRSMPPPRPAPTFAPPPAPTIQECPSSAADGVGFLPVMPAPTPQKSFRNSVAQRAMRLSLTSPKPPPLSALPPRPHDLVEGHRRSSSSGTCSGSGTGTGGSSDRHSSSTPSSLSRASNATPSIPRTPPPRSLSIRQRLRILSTPPASPLSVHSAPQSPSSIQISTLDLGGDNEEGEEGEGEDDLPTPCQTTAPRAFGLGEHIIPFPNDARLFPLQSPPPPAPVPAPPLTRSMLPKPLPHPPHPHPHPTQVRIPPRASSLSSGMMDSAMRRLPLPRALPHAHAHAHAHALAREPDCDFVALSPPPPRRSSKPPPRVVPVTTTTTTPRSSDMRLLDVSEPVEAAVQWQGSKLSRRASVVSLAGFVM